MANEDYLAKGTSIKVNGEVGADVALSAEGLTNAAGRVSAQKDWGAAPRPYIYEWSCEVQFQATPTQYATFDIYVSEAPDDDSTQITGDEGTSDAALGDVDSLRNMNYIGSVTVENAAASEKNVASGTFESTARYHSYVVYNGTGATVNATDSAFRLDIVPKYRQIQ